MLWLFVTVVVVLCGASGCRVMSQGYNSEGVRLYQQGQYQGAIDRFQRALYNDPSDADSYYNLAATHHRLGKLQNNQTELEQAESYYNQCLDHDPDHADCYRGLAVLLTEQNRSEEAFRLMQGWVNRQPSLAQPKIELARLYDEFGDRERAKEFLLEALAVDAYNARALAALGKLYEELGNHTQALAVYQRSLWHNRLQPEVAARVAALQSALGPGPLADPGAGTRTAVSSAPVYQ